MLNVQISCPKFWWIRVMLRFVGRPMHRFLHLLIPSVWIYISSINMRSLFYVCLNSTLNRKYPLPKFWKDDNEYIFIGEHIGYFLYFLFFVFIDYSVWVLCFTARKLTFDMLLLIELALYLIWSNINETILIIGVRQKAIKG